MERMRTGTAEKLANWAMTGERDAPVAFVGRTREIDFATRQLTTWRARTSRGRTIVIQGAPGAGKTALLGEIERRLPSVVPDSRSIYLETPWAPDDIPSILEALAVQMMDVAEDSFRTATRTATTVGVKTPLAAARGRSRILSPPGLTTWRAFEREFQERAAEARPTLLLVDEVQRLVDDDGTKQLLFNLHDQSTFPLILVCGGLSTSSAHLAQLGLSRLDATHVLHLDALTLAEARQSLEASLATMAEDVGGVPGPVDLWARRLARPTHGWPQHITCHFRSAAEALLASRRLTFDDDNLERALSRAAASTRGYYDLRLEASRTDESIVFAVHEAINDGPVRRRDAMAIIEAASAVLSSHEKADHDRNFADASECVDQMLSAGLIAYRTVGKSSTLGIPIPSMAKHVADLLSADHREAVRRALGLPGRKVPERGP